MKYTTMYYTFKANRGAEAQSVTAKSIGCGFDPHSRRWNIYLNLYFYFFGVEAKRGVEFRHSILNASISAESGELSVLH